MLVKRFVNSSSSSYTLFWKPSKTSSVVSSTALLPCSANTSCSTGVSSSTIGSSNAGSSNAGSSNAGSSTTLFTGALHWSNNDTASPKRSLISAQDTEGPATLSCCCYSSSSILLLKCSTLA